MFKKIIAVLTALSLTVTPALADQFIFRYKSGYDVVAVQPEMPEENNYDIRANFVGYPGENFSQSIPVKGVQSVAYWRIVSGALPQGVVFDQATGLLSGVPVRIQTTSFDVVGFSSNGADETKAKITFSVVAPDERMVKVDGYGHVGRNMTANISPAGVVIDRWIAKEALPSWLKVSGALLQGTPPAGSVGVYAINMVGYDFSGTEVATARGSVLIEDGPTIAFIPDRVIDVNTYTTIAARVNRTLGELIWSLEGDALPQSLSSNGKGAIQGSLRNFNTNARMRFVARDIDGTTGYSNYFTIASSEPETDIRNILDQELIINSPFQMVVSATDLQGEKNWTIQSGELPEGISLNSKTGVISGTPEKLETKGNITLAVTSSNGGNGVSNPFSMTVFPAKITVAGEQAHVRVGKSFASAPLVITGAMQPYSIRLADGETLPVGLSLNPANGVVSGTLNSAVAHSLPLVVVDAEGRVSKSFSLGITSYNNLAISVSPQTTNVPRLKEVVSPVVSVAEQSIIPSKANPFGEYELAGTLPAGLTFAKTTGRIYGIPSVEGSYGPFTISVIDGSGERATSNAFQIEVGPREFLTATASDLTIYALQTLFNSRPVSVSNGVGKVTYELVGPSVLPEGVKLTQDGYLQGVPTKVGVSEGITVKATDSEGQTATTEPFKITVAPAKPIELADTSFEWTVGKAFNFDLKAVNAANPVTYVFADRNTLPTAVQISSTGQVTGTVATVGTYRATVTITDQQARTATVQITLAVKAAMAMQFASEHNFSRGSQVNLIPVVENAIGTPKFTQTGVLPDGLSFDASTGAISGVPNKEGEWANIQITARDDASNTASVTTKLIVGQRKTLAIAYDFSNNLTEGSGAGLPKFPVEPTNAIGDVTYSVAGTLPAGLTFNAGSGAFAGVPAVAGVFDNIVVTATDSEGVTAKTGAMSIRVEKGGQFKIKDLMVTARVGDFINTGAPEVENGVAPMSFAAGAGKPSGINVNLVNGSVSGTLTSTGTHSFVVTATDGVAKTANYNVTIVVVGDLKLAYPTSTNVNQFSEAVIEPTVDNLVGKASYELASGNLPSGMRVDVSTGKIVGAPEQTGTFPNIIVGIRDGGQTSYNATSNSFTIVVGQRLALEVENADENLALVNNTYELKAKALNAVGSVTWNISGVLPDGLSASNSTGTISGTPTSIGEWPSITLSAVDSKGATATKTIKITTAPDGHPLLLTTYAVKGKLGISFESNAPLVQNAIGEVRFSSPDLASYGLTIDPVTGVISGSLSTVTKITANVRVTDSTNRLTSEFIVIEIVPVIRIVMREAVDTTVGVDMNVAKPTVDYAVGTIKFELAGNLPAGLVFNNNTGAISGRPTLIANGEPLVIKVVDATGDSAMSEPFVINVHDNGVLPRVAFRSASFSVAEGGAVSRDVVRFSTQKVGDVYSINKPLPDGLIFDVNTGDITGKVAAGIAGFYQGYVVTVTDPVGNKGETEPLEIIIVPSSRSGVYQTKSAQVREGEPYDFGLPIFDETRMYGDITYSIKNRSTTSQERLDISLNERNGSVSAKAIYYSTAWFDIEAIDDFGRLSTTQRPLFRYSITVIKPTIDYNTIGQLEVNEYALTDEPILTNVKGTARFSLESGNLPDGLRLDELTGQLYGTPTQTGSFAIKVRMTDDYGYAVTVTDVKFTVQSTKVAAFEIPDLVDQLPAKSITSELVYITGNSGDVPMTFENLVNTTYVGTRVCHPSNPGGLCYNISISNTQPKAVKPGSAIQVQMISPVELGQTASVTIKVGDQSTVWNVTTEGVKNTPDQIVMAPSLDQATSTVLESGPYLINGINTDTVVELSGGIDTKWRYCGSTSVNNCRAFGADTVVKNGSYIRVQTKTSPDFETATPVTLKIGNMTAVWDVKTRALNDTPDDFNFTPIVDAAPNAGLLNSNSVKLTGIPDEVPFTVTYHGNNPTAFTYTNHKVVKNTSGVRFLNDTVTGTVKTGDTIYISGMAEPNYSSDSYYTIKIGKLEKEFRITTRDLYDTPDDFNFENVKDADMAALVQSKTVSITGISEEVPFEITYHGSNPAAFSTTNHGVFTKLGTSSTLRYSFKANTLVGKVKPGDTLYINGLAETGFLQESYYVLKIGPVVKEYHITTRGLDDTPDDFEFTTQNDVAPDAIVTSNQITVTGISDPVPFEVTYFGTNPKANTNTQHRVLFGSTSSNFKTNTVVGTISNNQKFSISALTEAEGESSSYYVVKIGSVTKEFRLNTRAYVDTPEDFSFPDALNQAPYETSVAAILSAEVIIQGVPDPVPVTLTAVGNGAAAYFQKNGTTYQMGSVQMNNMTVKTGDKILIRGTAPRGNETEALYTLTVGTLTRTFKIVTRTLVTTPEPFTFTDHNGVKAKTGFTSNTITLAGIPDRTAFTITYIGSDSSQSKGLYVDGKLSFFTGETLNTTLKTGSRLALYATSSANPGEKVIIRVTAGDYTTDWTLTTAP